MTAALRSIVPLLALLPPAAAWAQASPPQPQQGGPTDRIGPRADHLEAARLLERVIEEELRDKKIPALSIALVAGEETVWARGFGFADPEKKVPATASTMHRVGSVSKLFTAMAVMQLVERGELDLDAPLERYLEGFRPRNPFAKPVTLRGLLCHRSGLVREPPAGSYFHPEEPSLAATVESLNTTALVHEPGTRTKYSNAGVAAAGYVIERRKGRPFEEVVEEAVLRPLGMERASFRRSPEVERRLARAVMATPHGRTFAAPGFALGTSPAGNLYADVLDLGRFLAALSARGRSPAGQVLRRETLDAMGVPQLASPGEEGRFGLGFVVSKLDGLKRLSHGGAVYGFATEVEFLPEEGLGVAVAATRDVANAVVERIATLALRAMLAVRAGRPLPAPALAGPFPPGEARRLAGHYRGTRSAVDVFERGGEAFLVREGLPRALRLLEGELTVDDALGRGPALRRPGEGKLVLDGEVLERGSPPRPGPPPARWEGLIGEYGWDHNVLYIHERDGRLWALIEWFFPYPLEEISPDEFAFPDRGLYQWEKLRFRRDDAGKAREVEAAGVVFARRPPPAEAGGVFRISPRRSLEELRAEARAEQPPVEAGPRERPELVDVASLDPAIRLEVRYASTANFLGAPVYPVARAFLARPAAEALLKALGEVKAQGYGFLIHDGYRPWHVTKLFWEATPPEMRDFVADPAKGSRHNRGAAVDLSLYELSSGTPAAMPGVYDEFSDRSYADYPGGTSLERWHRDLLRRAMEGSGFSVYPLEWWHHDLDGWERFAILNVPLEEIPPSAGR